MPLSLEILPDDCLIPICRASSHLLEPKRLVALGTTCHNLLRICQPELTGLQDRRATARALLVKGRIQRNLLGRFVSLLGRPDMEHTRVEGILFNQRLPRKETT